jgi:8-oxo-dGTP pyrophosphatase MutT (NUDIX family)
MAKPVQNTDFDFSLQVAALPVRRHEGRALEVLLITSRETGRWVIPKGWPMKGRKDHEAAAQEALEEAGVVGRVQKTPLGEYLYLKRLDDHFELCRVAVYRLDVERQRKKWNEMAQRRCGWFSIDEAVGLVLEPGLVMILRDLQARAQTASVSR